MNELKNFFDKITNNKAVAILRKYDESNSASVLLPSDTLEGFVEKIQTIIDSEDEYSGATIVNVQEFDYGYLLELNVSVIYENETHSRKYELIYSNIY